MTDLEQSKYQVRIVHLEEYLDEYFSTSRTVNGASAYMDDHWANGTSLQNGLLTTNSTLTMSAGLSRFLVYTRSTRQTDRLRPFKTLLLVSQSTSSMYIHWWHSLDVFRPLFEVTKDPSTHPELHVFLQRVIGFDTVDDESKVERRIHKKFPYPRLWNYKQSPPYSYWWGNPASSTYTILIQDWLSQGLLYVREHSQSK